MQNYIKNAAALLALIILSSCGGSGKEPANVVTLLNVSYDPTRELYQDLNREFSSQWKIQSGQEIRINMSHGGSGSQSRAVIEGLDADVVTLALAQDVSAIHNQANLLSAGWQSELPENSAPYTSTIVFLVRKGNPKNIRNWNDLARENIEVITPNPKTSGAARWNYLAMWGFALDQKLGDPGRARQTDFAAEAESAQAYAKEFVTKIYKNVPVLDQAARAATNTFIQRGIGDVLINWENEILLAQKVLNQDEYEIVIPPISILAEPTVAIVDKNVDRKGTREPAEAYLNFLYTETAQDIIAKHYYRPRSAETLKKFEHQFVPLRLFTIVEVFGGWQNATEVHFSNGGIFDQIYQ